MASRHYNSFYSVTVQQKSLKTIETQAKNCSVARVGVLPKILQQVFPVSKIIN